MDGWMNISKESRGHRSFNPIQLAAEIHVVPGQYPQLFPMDFPSFLSFNKFIKSNVAGRWSCTYDEKYAPMSKLSA